MNRGGWQQLALDRAADAKALLDAGRWAAAYYLAGYVVECGLKACVLKRVEVHGVIFDDPKFAAAVRTHRFDELVRLADLAPQLGQRHATNAAFLGFWGVASTWSEESRYQMKGQSDAEQLYDAVTNDPDGVLKWMQLHW